MQYALAQVFVVNLGEGLDVALGDGVEAGLDVQPGLLEIADGFPDERLVLQHHLVRVEDQRLLRREAPRHGDEPHAGAEAHQESRVGLPRRQVAHLEREDLAHAKAAERDELEQQRVAPGVAMACAGAVPAAVVVPSPLRAFAAAALRTICCKRYALNIATLSNAHHHIFTSN